MTVVARAPAAANTLGWLIVALSFLAIGFAYALRSSLGLMMPLWEVEQGWTRPVLSSVGAVVLVVMAVAGPISGNLLDRIGARAVTVVGLIAAGVGAVLTAAVAAQWHLFGAFGLFVGVANGVLSVPLAAAVVALYFDHNRGLATGIASAGSTGGQLFALPAIAGLFGTVGWRAGYLALGIGAIAFAVAAWFVIRERSGAAAARRAAAARAPLDRRLAMLFRHRVFLLLFGAFSLCGFTTAGLVDVHFLPYAAMCGFTPIESSTAYGIHGLFNLGGMILAGWLADRTHRARLLAGIFFVRAVTFVLLMYVGNDLYLAFAFTAAFGFLNFAVLPVIASIVASRVGLHVMGLSMGLLAGGHSLGAAVGAFLGGSLSTALGSYDAVWLIGLAAAVAAAAFSLGVGEPRTAPPQPSPATA
jgi:predicted MFS family arabinose efflux permease